MMLSRTFVNQPLNQLAKMTSLQKRSPGKNIAHQHMDVLCLSCKFCCQKFASTQVLQLQKHERMCGMLYSNRMKNKCSTYVRRRFRCAHDNCTREYSSKQCLDDHVRAYHTNKVISCKFCGKTFKWRTSLIRHRSKECTQIPAVNYSVLND